MTALTNRRHIGKQEEDIPESGIQFRPEDPAFPVDRQLWLNTTQQRIKFQDQARTLVLAESGIGRALEVPETGDINLLNSRSYFTTQEEDYTVPNFINPTEGAYFFLRVANPNVASLLSFEATIPDPSEMTDGNYWLLKSSKNLSEFFVWYDFFGEEAGDPSSDPALAGKTGIRVIVSPGRAQRSTVTAVAANEIVSGSYFRLFSQAGVEWIIWYNIDGASTDPTDVGGPEEGKNSIQVALLSADTDEDVASKSATVINANASFNSSATGNQFDIINVQVGDSLNPEDVNVGGDFNIDVVEPGFDPDDADYAAEQTAIAIDALSDFDSASIADNFISVQVTQDGVTDHPEAGNMPGTFSLDIIGEGQGRIFLTMPAGVILNAGDTLEVPAESEKIFTLIPIDGEFLTSADTFNL